MTSSPFFDYIMSIFIGPLPDRHHTIRFMPVSAGIPCEIYIFVSADKKQRLSVVLFPKHDEVRAAWIIQNWTT